MTDMDGQARDEPSRADIEQLCWRNLLSVREERVFFKDRQHRFLLVSEGWLTGVADGMPLESVIGKTDSDFFTGPHAAGALEAEQWVMETGEPIIGRIERETFNDRPDAWVSTNRWPLRNAEGEIVGTFGVSRDITAEMLDPVTGLANRLALMDRLRQAVAALDRTPGRIALLFLDVDGFKAINDAWGHRTGDRVLSRIGNRLNSVSRRFDTVARYGGDEFVMLVTALREEENVLAIGERVREAICAPLHAGGQALALTASIGAVLCTDPHADIEELLEQGDIAMYAAKRSGRGRLVIYDADVHAPMGRQVSDAG
jgi:diguanylate cyclase (GGDEF)-like protein